MTAVFKLAGKLAAFKAQLELRGNRQTLGSDIFQTLAMILREAEPVASFSELMHCLVLTVRGV